MAATAFGCGPIRRTRPIYMLKPRADARTRESPYAWRRAAIDPYARYGEKKLRFNWNTPVQVSPNEKGTIYIGRTVSLIARATMASHGTAFHRI